MEDVGYRTSGNSFCKRLFFTQESGHVQKGKEEKLRTFLLIAVGLPAALIAIVLATDAARFHGVWTQDFVQMTVALIIMTVLVGVCGWVRWMRRSKDDHQT